MTCIKEIESPTTSFKNPQTKPFQIITIVEDAHSKIKNWEI
jgi:hypothetical protein